MVVSLIHEAVNQGNIAEIGNILSTSPGQLEHVHYQYTPLLAATTSGLLKVVQYLVKQGANLEYQDSAGQSAVLLAADGNHLEILKFLIYSGANGRHRDHYGQGVLAKACIRKHVELVQYLLSIRTLDVDVRDRGGRSCLWYAGGRSEEKIVKLLLEGGADPTVSDDDGRTVLERARIGHYEGSIQLIETAMKEVERTSLLFKTRLLHDAAMIKTYSAPAYLRRRIEQTLPQVEIKATARVRFREEEREVPEEVAKHVIKGGLVKELFMELMESMMTPWDPIRGDAERPTATASR